VDLAHGRAGKRSPTYATTLAQLGVELVERLDGELADLDAAECGEDLGGDVALIAVASGELVVGGVEPPLEQLGDCGLVPLTRPRSISPSSRVRRTSASLRVFAVPVRRRSLPVSGSRPA
jgi:hypothetical protein